MSFIEKLKIFIKGTDLDGVPDEELVERFISEQDDKVFYEIWNRHGNNVFSLAYRITRDHHSAEEILQEVMTQLVLKLDTFKGEAKFSSWLYRVTANASYTHLRSSKKHASEISLDTYAPYDENGTLMGKIAAKGWSHRADSVLYSKESMEIIEKAINELPEPYRVVFLLRDVEGFTNKEVSETLAISIAAVKTRLHRARLFLRDKISDYFHEGGGLDQ